MSMTHLQFIVDPGLGDVVPREAVSRGYDVAFARVFRRGLATGEADVR